MKKVYISPRIMVEKMNVSLLLDTSEIHVNENLPKSLDAKDRFGYFDDEEDED